MPCVICGSVHTVEAHLVPRALYRMLAGPDQHGYEGSLFRPGVRFQAKGVFDPDLLCRAHEGAFREADDYGVRFIRRFHDRGRETARGHAWLVPNPKPHLLVRFVAGCIWRRGMSPVRREGADVALGVAEPKLRRMLFEGDDAYRPPLMISRRTLVSQGEEVREVMFEPCKMWGFGDGSWAFLALGCDFKMKLNPFSSPAIPPMFLANGKDPVWCMNMPPEEAVDVEGFLDIAVNMLRDPRRGGSRRRGR